MLSALDSYLHHLKAPIAILAGAGVSMDAPAGLPNAKQLIRTTVQHQLGHLISPETLDQLLERTDQFPTRPGEFLRFEVAMYGLDDQTRCGMLGDLQQGAPNHNHFILARLLERGNVVVTTNFDRHIETAYQNLFQRECPVVVREADFRPDALSAAPGTLFKIHGCLSELTTVAATFTAVMAQNSNRMRWLVRLLEELDLIVVGYSGADDLDLVPPLARTITERRLLWVDHREREPTWLEPQAWLKRTSARMHLDVVGLSRILFSARSPSNSTRLDGHVAVVEAPTQDVLHRLAARWGFPTMAPDNSGFVVRAGLHALPKPVDELTAAKSALNLVRSRRGAWAEKVVELAQRDLIQHGMVGSPGQQLDLLVDLFNSAEARSHLARLSPPARWAALSEGADSAFFEALERLAPAFTEEERVLELRLRGCLVAAHNPAAAQAWFEQSLALAKELLDPTAELSTLNTYSDLLYPSYFPMFWYEHRPFPHTERLQELVHETGFLPMAMQSRHIRNIDYANKLQIFDPSFVDSECSVGFMAVFRDAMDVRRMAIDLGDVRGEMEATFVLAELSLTAAVHFDRVPYLSLWIEWQRLRLLSEALDATHQFGERLPQMTSVPPPDGEISVEELGDSMFPPT